MDQPPLLTSQQLAIEHIRLQAIALRPEAREVIHHILRMSNLPASTCDELLNTIRESARVAVHFHPDRLSTISTTAASSDATTSTTSTTTVSRGLLESGRYRSQFETGISNGSVSAFAGGPRDEWERALFGGAYHQEGQQTLDDSDAAAAVAAAAARPKYGALDLTLAGDGPAPRFGSCYLVLRPAVSPRCTFTAGGSQDEPRAKGTVDEFDAVLAAVLEEVFVRDAAVGLRDVRPAGFVRSLLGLKGGNAPEGPGRGTWMSRNLDHYVEAQVHGELSLGRDVEEMVADPSFRDSETGDDLEAVAERYGFPLRWHAGSRVKVEDVPLDFRGPTMPSLAERVATAAAGAKDGGGGVVDARAIGESVRGLTREPKAWADRGSYREVLQELKLLWHVLVRFGEPAAEQ